MVGALADWFAVTALFRHPLGIPIPHTAIIPRKKDDLAGSLESFFADNFLTEDIVSERILDAGIAGKAGGWVCAASGAAITSVEEKWQGGNKTEEALLRAALDHQGWAPMALVAARDAMGQDRH